MRKQLTQYHKPLFIFLAFLFTIFSLKANTTDLNTLSVFCTPIAVASTPTTENGSVLISISGATASFELLIINTVGEIIEEQVFDLSAINFT